MIRYIYWVGGGVLGALIGIVLGAKWGYAAGIFIGDVLYHAMAGRQAAYEQAT